MNHTFRLPVWNLSSQTSGISLATAREPAPHSKVGEQSLVINFWVDGNQLSLNSRQVRSGLNLSSNYYTKSKRWGKNIWQLLITEKKNHTSGIWKRCTSSHTGSGAKPGVTKGSVAAHVEFFPLGATRCSIAGGNGQVYRVRAAEDCNVDSWAGPRVLPTLLYWSWLLRKWFFGHLWIWTSER